MLALHVGVAGLLAVASAACAAPRESPLREHSEPAECFCDPRIVLTTPNAERFTQGFNEVMRDACANSWARGCVLYLQGCTPYVQPCSFYEARDPWTIVALGEEPESFSFLAVRSMFENLDREESELAREVSVRGPERRSDP